MVVCTGIGPILRIFEKSTLDLEERIKGSTLSSTSLAIVRLLDLSALCPRVLLVIAVASSSQPDEDLTSLCQATHVCACPCRHQCVLHGSIVFMICVLLPRWAWSQHIANECRRGIHWPVAALLARALLLSYGI
jgi:hypothetical protein